MRGYLDALDHAETLAYLRAQVTAAGLAWDALFEAGCDDAVYKVTEGVPRLVNQVCDQALVLVAESNRHVTPADIAASWCEIQRLPAPSGIEPMGSSAGAEAGRGCADAFDSDDLGVIEFGVDTSPASDRHPAAATPEASAAELWSGPDVELVFDPTTDPFEEFFADEEPVVERFVMNGPDTFRGCRNVSSR